jgi:hypothetical protein
MRKAGQVVNLDDLYRPTGEEIGYGLAAAGFGAGLGAAAGALSGLPGWVSERNAAGLPWQPANEDEQGELNQALGQNVGGGALAGAAMMALGEMERQRKAGDERVVEAIANLVDIGAHERVGAVPGAGPAAVGPVALLPAVAASAPRNLDPELGARTMMALARGIEDGRVRSRGGTTDRGYFESAGQLLGNALSSLPADEAAKYYDFALRVNDPAEANTSLEDWINRSDHVVFDQAGWMAALNEAHRPPDSGEMRWVGGREVNEYPVLEDHVKLYSMLQKLQTHENSSPEDRALAMLGSMATRRHVGLKDHYTRMDYLEAAGHPDKMQAYVDDIKSISSRMGFELRDWNPYGWHHGRL